jgi:DNA-binding SARP family transcriptional activator
MSTLLISLFGTLHIGYDDESIQPKLAPRTQALLAYLLLQGPRLHSREMVLDIFWGDQNPNQARSCLTTALWRLRRALKATNTSHKTYLLTPPTGEIGFNWQSNHWLDVTTFEAQVNRVLAQPISALAVADVQLMEKALRLYTGDLLEGFYDDWAIREQERLRCLYLDCLEHLMQYYRHHGVYEKSLAYGQQILTREPLHEEVHRDIMRLYLEMGQRALAVRQYEQCRDILARELKLSPMPETQELYTQALNLTSQATLAVPRTNLKQALQQLNLVTREVDQARQQVKQANQRLEQAQQQLQDVLELIEWFSSR